VTTKTPCVSNFIDEEPEQNPTFTDPESNTNPKILGSFPSLVFFSRHVPWPKIVGMAQQ